MTVAATLKSQKIKYNWDGTYKKAIVISLAGKPIPREQSFEALLVAKLRKDTGGKFKIVSKRGKHGMTTIEFDVDTDILKKLLKEYSIRAAKPSLPPEEVREDTYLIRGNKLHVNYSEGISATTYNKIKSD